MDRGLVLYEYERHKRSEKGKDCRDLHDPGISVDKTGVIGFFNNRSIGSGMKRSRRFGIPQVNGFGHDLPFGAGEKQEIMAEAVYLGNAKTPASLHTAADRAVVEKAYHTSFIDAYARIMQISAVLAFLGALMSFIFIKNKPPIHKRN